MLCNEVSQHLKVLAVDLSFCLGDPKNPAAKNKAFVTILRDGIYNKQFMDDLPNHIAITKSEIQDLIETFERG